MLAAMAPKILRFPSGATSKFQHPLGSSNTASFISIFNAADPAHTKTGLRNGGFGYDLEEIIRYYNKTNNNMFDLPSYNAIINDMLDNSHIDGNWLEDVDKADFETFYNRWVDQPSFNATDYTVAGVEQIWNEPLYINNFIDLISYIETTKGYVVDVISAINILSEPAYKVTQMIDYMRNASLNHKYAVHLIGIEMGNECYFSFYGRSMGFKCDGTNSAFDHYWAYINGANDYDDVFGADAFELSDVLSADMRDDDGGAGFNNHDYVKYIRTNPAYNNIKIGIPVTPASANGAYTILNDELVEEPAGGCPTKWNASVVSKYAVKESGRFVIDAVIPHLYLSGKNGEGADNINWGEIPVGGYTAAGGVLIPNCLDNDMGTTDYDNFNTTPYLNFAADPRLSCAFEGIIDPSNDGSFLKFVKQQHKAAMEHLATDLALDGSAENQKVCWITERNIKNNYLEGSPGTQVNAKYLRRSVYDNTFVHAYLNQEEFLNYIKLNYQSGFQEQFITITSFNNFLGGASTDLVRNSNEADLHALGLIPTCSSGFKPFLTRTLYYQYRLANQIHLRNLDYLKTVKSLYTSNINQPPTFFIATSGASLHERDVYAYFSNIKKEPQTYIIKPGTLSPNPLTGIHATLHYIEANNLYSGSGENTLYDINDYYGSCLEGEYEIRNEGVVYVDNGECPTGAPGSMCVTVPPFSCGYFVFTYDPILKTGDLTNSFNLFPNPTSTNFIIEPTNAAKTSNTTLDVTIISAQGAMVAHQYALPGEPIDISNLPVGVYQILIKTPEYIESELVVKMK